MTTKQYEQIQQDCEYVFRGMNDMESFMSLDKSSVLITGGTGFFGAWIGAFLYYIQKTLNIKIKLYIIGRDKQKFDQRFDYYQNDIEFIRCDVRHLTEIPKDVNYVINAAGNPDIRFHAANPIEVMTTISAGTQNVLEAAGRASNIRMILHLSSASVYCKQPPEEMIGISEGQFPGNTSLDSIRSAYVESKRYAEVLCAAARSELRVPICVLRPFSFIGPFQAIDAPWAVNNFINDVISKRPIRIMGDGKAIRGFMYGADAAGWIVKLLTNAKPESLYNIGSPYGFTLQEIAKKVADKVSPAPDIILNASLLPVRDTVKAFLPDVSRISNFCNVRQYTDIDMVIKRTIEWNKGL